MSELYVILEESLNKLCKKGLDLEAVIGKLYWSYIHSVMNDFDNYNKMRFCISTLISISSTEFNYVITDLLISINKYVELYPFIVDLKNEILEKDNSRSVQDLLKNLYEIQ